MRMTHTSRANHSGCGCVCVCFPQTGLVTTTVFLLENFHLFATAGSHVGRPQFPFMLCATRLSFLLCWIGHPDKEDFAFAPDDPEGTAPTWLITLTLLLPLDHAQTGHGGFLFGSDFLCVCVCGQKSYASYCSPRKSKSILCPSAFIHDFAAVFLNI